jgi:sugar transferase (PEP-CTERM/EpsH1 system associated)
MNILFLCHRIPFPPNKGDKIRAFNILTHLAKTHTVHLAAFVDDPDDMQHAEHLRSLARGECLFVPLNRTAAPVRMLRALVTGGPLTTSYFASRRLNRWIGDLLRSHDIDRAVLFSTATAPFLQARRDFDPARVILDMVDVDSDKWRQYATARLWPLSWIFRREARTLFDLERKAVATFAATLLVSPFEVKTFADLAPELRARVHCLPNGVDLEYFSPVIAHPNPFGTSELPIVMTGTMSYRPNDEGAIWFAENVLPIIRAALPNARFYAVGAKPTAKLKALGGLGVVVTGAVNDVRPYLAHASTVVAPILISRGVQNKVLEGMAMQKPVVATPQAIRALDVVPGLDLWSETEPRRFARAVIEAVQGADRMRIAANGRLHVERNYDWARNLATLDRLLEISPRSQLDVCRAGTPQAATAAGGLR